MAKKVVAMGEMLMRLSTPNHDKLLRSDSFDVNYGGAELNVANNLSMLDLDVTAITKVPDNEVGDAGIRILNSYGVNTDYIAKGGERLGIYFLEPGYSVRNSKVVYDRKNSSFSKVSIDEFDLDAIFEGVSIFHVCGITLAVSEDTFKLAEAFMKEAKKREIKVSFDFNYRSKLWSLDEAKVAFEKILKYVDIALAGYLDFTNILGFESKEESLMDIYKDLYPKVMKKYGFEYIVSTIREVNSASKNSYRGLCYNGKQIIESTKYEIDIIDRVGSGDAFTSGFIYSYLNFPCDEYKIEFATASGALKHTIHGDINMTSKEEIESLFKSKSFEVGR